MKTVFRIILLSTLTFIATNASAIDRDPAANRLTAPAPHAATLCQGRPEFVRENRTEIVGGFEALPKEVFIAREAEMWIEGREPKSSLKIHSFQSFVSAHSRTQGKIVCASSAKDFADRFSLIAPTLIDRTATHRTGQSLWQFQVIADRENYSVWNKRSPSLAKSDNVETVLKAQRSSYRLFQIGPDEFELLVQKETGASIQTLSIRYEAAR